VAGKGHAMPSPSGQRPKAEDGAAGGKRKASEHTTSVLSHRTVRKDGGRIRVARREQDDAPSRGGVASNEPTAYSRPDEETAEDYREVVTASWKTAANRSIT